MADIRPLGDADREQWAALRFALWPDHDAAELAGELPDFLADPAQAAFGSFDAGRMIGVAECSERPWGDGCDTRPVAWLEGIYVVPDRRRRGVAAALTAAVEDWARARGLTELGSDAVIDNHASIAAHGRWGFAETERLVLFRKALA